MIRGEEDPRVNMCTAKYKVQHKNSLKFACADLCSVQSVCAVQNIVASFYSGAFIFIKGVDQLRSRYFCFKDMQCLVYMRCEMCVTCQDVLIVNDIIII